MTKATYSVLFLCTGNSARSVFAEVILNRLGNGKFRAFSAGSHPRGEIHPLTLAVLREHGDDTNELRSKSWDEFATSGAPMLDFVFTVCDDAAGEACPVWPGQPITAHWGVEDPAAAAGSVDERRWAFRRVYQVLERRIELFSQLSFEGLDRLAVRARVTAIGKVGRGGAESA
jgi:arsenate reductase